MQRILNYLLISATVICQVTPGETSRIRPFLSSIERTFQAVFDFSVCRMSWIKSPMKFASPMRAIALYKERLASEPIFSHVRKRCMAEVCSLRFCLTAGR